MRVIDPQGKMRLVEPEIRYAKSGSVNIAYQTIGEGEHDLVFAPGFVSNIELGWSMPGRGTSSAAWPRSLA